MLFPILLPNSKVLIFTACQFLLNTYYTSSIVLGATWAIRCKFVWRHAFYTASTELRHEALLRRRCGADKNEIEGGVTVISYTKQFTYIATKHYNTANLMRNIEI